MAGALSTLAETKAGWLGWGRRGTAGAAIPMALGFENVTQRFGSVTALADVSLSIKPGEIVALLGQSGCGKTTLLRLAAGVERPSTGRVLLEGRDVSAPNRFVEPEHRGVGFVFQDYALFPHLSVAGNIAYGLKREGLPRAEIDRRVEEMLALVKLSGLGGRRPHQLSGGQRQRVALARSLAKRPKLLLLDEPMAALDKKLREQTQFELMDLQSELGLTFMVVTHDQDEAMTMADRMAVMDHGKLVQIGPPDVIYEAPASRHVAEFVGDINIFEGKVAAVEGELVRAEVPHVGTVELDEEAPALKPGEPLVLGIRPEKIEIGHDEPGQVVNKVAGEIWDIGYLGDFTMIQVMLGRQDDQGEGGQLVKVALANRTRRMARPFAWDDKVWLSWDVEAGVVLPP
jgi:putrescine transport system ATP-binding protein